MIASHPSLFSVLWSSGLKRDKKYIQLSSPHQGVLFPHINLSLFGVEQYVVQSMWIFFFFRRQVPFWLAPGFSLLHPFKQEILGNSGFFHCFKSLKEMERWKCFQRISSFLSVWHSSVCATRLFSENKKGEGESIREGR